MNSIAAMARTSALSLEVKKDGFTQRQDGSVILRLRCHPNEMPDAVMKAPMGTRYMAVLVEIDDNEIPIARLNGEVHAATVPVEAADTGCKTPDRPHAPRKPVAADKRLAHQAAISCADPVFRRFLFEKHSDTVKDEETASSYVRIYCRVTSRAEITPGTRAAADWDYMHGRFLAWKLA